MLVKPETAEVDASSIEKQLLAAHNETRWKELEWGLRLECLVCRAVGSGHRNRSRSNFGEKSWYVSVRNLLERNRYKKWGLNKQSTDFQYRGEQQLVMRDKQRYLR